VLPPPTGPKRERTDKPYNFHAWGLAAVQNALAAAQVFIKLVDEPAELSKADSGCGICREVLAEEDLRISELVSCLSRADVSDWLRTTAVLCIPHGLKLRRQVPPVLSCSNRCHHRELSPAVAEELQHLRDEPEPDRTGWGALGRAAEFLVSQRGLHS
jgi:hypothetical protein